MHTNYLDLTEAHKSSLPSFRHHPDENPFIKRSTDHDNASLGQRCIKTSICEAPCACLGSLEVKKGKDQGHKGAGFSV